MTPAKSIGAAVERPNSSIRFYLFHGADESGSRALAARLLAGLAAEKHSLSAASLRTDPARLADEASALPMFGGKRLLWIEPAGDEICPSVQALLELPAAEHPVVAVAGALRKTSALLKLAQGHSAVLAHVSYIPEGQRADQLVLELGRAEGLRIAPALATRIARCASADQAVIQQELAKFALYLDASPDRPQALTEEAVDLLGADGEESDGSEVVDLALNGNVAALGAELERLESSAIEPIPVLRAAERRILMLLPLRARLDAGQPLGDVMASVWKDKPLISRVLSRWSSDRLAHLLERVVKLERQVLLGKAPGHAALGEELLKIGRAAAR